MRVTCNGKNLNYGKAGQRIEISDWHFRSFNKSKETPFYRHTAKYAGSGKFMVKVIGKNVN